jgi:hypothetical protein
MGNNNNIDRLAALYERCAKLEREIVALRLIEGRKTVVAGKASKDHKVRATAHTLEEKLDKAVGTNDTGYIEHVLDMIEAILG